MLGPFMEKFCKWIKTNKTNDLKIHTISHYKVGIHQLPSHGHSVTDKFGQSVPTVALTNCCLLSTYKKS